MNGKAPTAPPTPIAALTVANGTAEQLARIARFRGFEDIQPEELDEVALFLIGDVGGPVQARELWEQLRAGDCHRLWYLITDDWDDRDLDDACRADEGLTAEQEIDARYARTRARLCNDIEHAIWLARYKAREARLAVAR